MIAFKDLRDYLDHLRGQIGDGAVKEITGAAWDLEIGCISELSAEAGGPALLFDDITGYAHGFRVLTNYMGSPAACAVAQGLPPDTPKIDIVRGWKDGGSGGEPFAPTDVGDGPVLDNVLEGDDVDLSIFPTPRWKPHDGGRYIGTACMVLTIDPDTGWVNAGTYRCCVQDRDRLSVWFTLPTRHGRVTAEKYWTRNQPCPISVVVGCDPTLTIASAMSAPFGASEYDYAGALRRQPVEVLYPPGSAIPVPAHAEIVLEGQLLPEAAETAPEGPFGEWTGYYTHSGREPVMRVTRILHRDDPIILGAPLMIPTITPGDQAIPLYSASSTWAHLEAADVQDIRGVWGYGRQLMMVISIAQRSADHAMHALLAASGRARPGAMERYFVVVDDDIDPSDLNQVLWAIFTRVDPAESIQTIRKSTSSLDPRLSPRKAAENDYSMGIALIDACKPFQWKNEYPQSNRFGEEFRQEIRNRWKNIVDF